MTIDMTTALSNLSLYRPRLHRIAGKAVALVLGLFLALSLPPAQGQVNSLNENFGDGSGDGNSANLPANWATINLSQTAGTVSAGDTGPWSAYSTSADGPSGAYLLTPPGSDASYVLTGFNATTDSSDVVPLSDWLITPYLNLSNGATLTFLTQSANPAGGTDSLEIRYAVAGSSTAAAASLTGGSSTSVGLFTGVIGILGSSTTPGLYPQTTDDGGWVSESFTLTGLPAGVSAGDIAFRYVSGDASNASYLGLADVAYTANAVPEPSSRDLTWVVGLAGLAGLSLRHLRRGKTA